MTLRARRSTVAPASAIEAHPLCLHVYRIGGIWSDDKIVRAEDKKTPRYYLRGTRFAANWQFALHVGGPNGPIVCHVKSPYLGPPWPSLVATDPAPISIAVGSEGLVHVRRRTQSVSDGAHSFRGLDDNEYRWRHASSRSRMKSGARLECLNAQDQIVATYRITLFAISKDGELRINQSVLFMADLLVATCLAIRIPDH